MCTVSESAIKKLSLFLSEDNIEKQRLLEERIKSKEPAAATIKSSKDDSMSQASSSDQVTAFLDNVTEEDEFSKDEF
jgi:hypothetical protein